jgi:Family of unknown function (DUF5343)
MGGKVPTYPYSSGQTAVVQTFAQLRNSFPVKVDAGYLQRFNIAPSNESYIISILRFLNLIDEDGNRIGDNTSYFFGNDDAFMAGLESTLRSAYSQVFDEMGEGVLDASKADLTNWFRGSDRTSDLVGQRQASTFQTLAALAGHGNVPATRGAAKKTTTATPAPASRRTTARRTPPTKQEQPGGGDGGGEARGAKNWQDVGLTVRIEVNLPPGGDAETYDAIFASIRKHLMS